MKLQTERLCAPLGLHKTSNAQSLPRDTVREQYDVILASLRSASSWFTLSREGNGPEPLFSFRPDSETTWGRKGGSRAGVSQRPARASLQQDRPSALLSLP